MVLAAMLTTISAESVFAQSAASDPVAELADLFAFVDPPCTGSGGTGCEADPEELIVVLTMNSFAPESAQFSPDVEYHFYFENDAGEERTIDCSFNDTQRITCAGMDGLSVSAPIDTVRTNGDLRVYAGLRDDPNYFDLDALEEFSQIGIAAYSPPGNDSLAGSNVLAIVLGISISAMPAGAEPDHNLNKIWASSERVAGGGINGAISGSWYNPQQDGQGWVIEVVGRGSQDPSFLAYFYGYANDGEQLWMITGDSEIDGNQATADIYRPTASGFGGDYNPGSFVLGDVVGTVTFDFEECDSGMVTFESADTATLADFSNDLTRLSNIASLDCSLLATGQVDRVGRPYIESLIPGDMIDEYKSNSDQASWNAAYRSTILGSLNVLATADGNPAWNGFGTADDWGGILTDDRLQIDVKKAQSVDYLSIELSQLVPQDWNDSAGRALDYDIHETFFNVIITSFDPFIDDYLDGNDLPFLNNFPFLAEPH